MAATRSGPRYLNSPYTIPGSPPRGEAQTQEEKDAEVPGRAPAGDALRDDPRTLSESPGSLAPCPGSLRTMALGDAPLLAGWGPRPSMEVSSGQALGRAPRVGVKWSYVERELSARSCQHRWAPSSSVASAAPSRLVTSSPNWILVSLLHQMTALRVPCACRVASMPSPMWTDERVKDPTVAGPLSSRTGAREAGRRLHSLWRCQGLGEELGGPG